MKKQKKQIETINNIEDVLNGKRISFIKSKIQDFDLLDKLLCSKIYPYEHYILALDLAEFQTHKIQNEILKKSEVCFDIDGEMLYNNFIPDRCNYWEFRRIILQDLNGEQEKWAGNRLLEVNQLKKDCREYFAEKRKEADIYNEAARLVENKFLESVKNFDERLNKHIEREISLAIRLLQNKMKIIKSMPLFGKVKTQILDDEGKVICEFFEKN
jgi:hypothetical protein